ncbi:hypothetical protein DRN85_10955 [Methanosarcinales archaeon]|nr:MAG: hypothetical protein DRN85_10955 [Methanosarcinales archaeon]
MMIIPAPPDKTDMKRVIISESSDWVKVYSRDPGVMTARVALSNDSDQTLEIAYKREGTAEKYDTIDAHRSLDGPDTADEIYVRRTDTTASATVAVHEDWYSEAYLREIERAFIDTVAEGVFQGMVRYFSQYGEVRRAPAKEVTREVAQVVVSQASPSAGLFMRILNVLRGERR